jgi:hypothetical protein
MRCLFKSIEPSINPDYPYLEVDYATYESITICDNFQVINNVISKIKTVTSHKKLNLSVTGQFVTTKDNMLFLADQNFTGDTENWDYIRYDH